MPAPNPSPERLTVTVEEAAKLLGISRGSAYTLARSGGFPVPTIRMGKLIRVPKMALDRLLNPAV